MKKIFSILTKLLLLGIIIFIPYFIYLYFFTPQKIEINEVTSSLSDFKVENLGISELSINNQNFGYPVEITPVVIPQSAGKPNLYLLPTGWTWLCTGSGNILNSTPASPFRFDAQNCKLITKSDIIRSVESNGQPIPIDPKISNVTSTPWKMTYNGAFSLHVINNNRLVGIKHGENQNLIDAGYKYQNTVYPNVLVDNCAAGVVNGVYHGCGESFSTYANLGWADYNPSTGWSKEEWYDEGPVLWPPGPNLYRETNGNRGIAGGSYHPTFFLGDDGYMYLYNIGAAWTEANHLQCNIVARSPVSSNLLPGTWKYYYNGSFSTDALPAGFSKEKINDFYSTPGGRASCIFSGTETIQHIYFNVAKVKNTPYYIGAEESLTSDNSWRLGIRISRDLVHWSDLQIISTAAGWGSGQKFSYPTFYNKEGNSSYEIDKNEFYLVGNGADNSSGYKLNKMKLSLTLPLSSNPSDYNSRPVKGTTNSTSVYFMEAGKKRGIPDWDTYIHGLGFKAGDEIVLPDSIINSFPMGTPVSPVPPHFFNGKPVKGTTDKNTIYLVENGIKRSYPNEALFLASFTHAQVIQLSDATLARIPRGKDVGDNTPSTKPGDLNGDDKVNLYDYTELIRGYSTLYNDDDFINVLSNYGK